MKYAWIQEHCDSFAIQTMCRVLQVSTSGFYQWLSAEPGPRAQRTEAIQADVRKVYEESHGVYGSYKIAETLKADDHLESACRNTVAKAMREMGLKSRVSRKFQPTTTVTDPEKKPAPNVLEQDFKADAPNRKC